MKTFDEYVEAAVAWHGHLCSGQCIGVKMALYGLSLLGLDPERDRKRIVTFVECDRCPADSIGVVTGCKVGKRTFKAMDYGKIAASFVDIATGTAVRIYRKKRMHPADGEDMIAFYRELDYEEMFSHRFVKITLNPCDLPGPPVEAVTCSVCGEEVTDARHVIADGAALCRACADGAYYVFDDARS